MTRCATKSYEEAKQSWWTWPMKDAKVTNWLAKRGKFDHATLDVHIAQAHNDGRPCRAAECRSRNSWWRNDAAAWGLELWWTIHTTVYTRVSEKTQIFETWLDPNFRPSLKTWPQKNPNSWNSNNDPILTRISAFGLKYPTIPRLELWGSGKVFSWLFSWFGDPIGHSSIYLKA